MIRPFMYFLIIIFVSFLNGCERTPLPHSSFQVETIAEDDFDRTQPNGSDPQVETIMIAGDSFQKITYPDGICEIKLGEHEIDFDEPLDDKIVAAKVYVPVVSELTMTSKYYPFVETGKRKIALSLVNLSVGGHPMTCKVETTIKRLGATPSDFAQLLEIAKAFPKLQREFMIVSLGFHWRDRDGNVIVPKLVGSSRGRGLRFTGRDGEWASRHYWFLVAR